MHVKRYVRELEKEGKKGRWVTKQYLTEIMKYSKLLGQHDHSRCYSFDLLIHRHSKTQDPRSMVENSWSWAQSKGLVRTNEVHKCEEARLVLEETFEHDTEKGTDRELHGEATVEDCTLHDFQFIPSRLS